MSKKGPRYVDWYLERERSKGKRFSESEVKALSQNYEGIYWHPDGKRFIAVANIPVVDEKGKCRYVKPEKIHSTVSDAKKWLESERAKGRIDFDKGYLPNPTLFEVISLTNSYKETKSGWRNFRNYRNGILDYFGEDRRLLSITEDHYLAFQSWLLKRIRVIGHVNGEKVLSPKGETLSPSTVNYYCLELVWLFRYAKRKGMISVEPAFPLLKKMGHRPFNIDLPDFLSCIKHVPKHQAMLLLALNTGGRKLDVTFMTEDRLSTRLLREVDANGKDVYRERAFITIKSSKTGKDNLQVPLLSELDDLLKAERKKRDAMLEGWFDRLTNPHHKDHRKALKQYERIQRTLHKRAKKKAEVKHVYHLPIPPLPLVKDLENPSDLNPDRYLFLNPANLLPYKSIQFALNTAIKKSGIKHFTMHVIRHLATTLLLDLTGGDTDLVQRIIGWSNKTMIQVYGHIGHRAVDTFARFDALLDRTKADMSSDKPTKHHSLRLVASPEEESEQVERGETKTNDYREKGGREKGNREKGGRTNEEQT